MDTEGSLWTSRSTSVLCMHCHGFLQRWRSLLPWRTSNATWMWAWATCSGWPCLNRLDDKSARSPFQLQPFSDSLKLSDIGQRTVLTFGEIITEETTLQYSLKLIRNYLFSKILSLRWLHIFYLRLTWFSLFSSVTVFLLCGLSSLAFLIIFKWLGFFGFVLQIWHFLMFCPVVFQWGTCQKPAFTGMHTVKQHCKRYLENSDRKIPLPPYQSAHLSLGYCIVFFPDLCVG